MRQIVQPAFFERDSHTVARDLLGMYLVRSTNEGLVRVQILDVEVYDGFEDKASHARAGLTARTSVMYGSAGFWYVYLCYGIHSLLNIVTREEGYPAAILIRGVEGAQGPGVLTRMLQIDRSFNGLLASEKSGLWIEGTPRAKKRIRAVPRVGVSYAGEEWAERPWRYILER